MSKVEIKNLLDNLLKENVITQNEYEDLVKELDTSEPEEFKSRLRELLTLKLDALNDEILKTIAEYGDTLTRLAELFKDDEELQSIVNGFNNSIESAVKEFNIELDKIEEEIKSRQE
ncbi:MAG: hypothetical protein QXD89_02950 [Candidatus Aenigmatarchaeota archaeon]